MDAAPTGREHDGRFRKGTSGNPAGRKKGSKNRMTMAAEHLLEGEAQKLTRRAIDLALAGDVTALKLCLERLIPRRHERSVTFPLPRVATPKDASAALARIMEGVSSGELAAGEARSLAHLVGVVVASHEAVDVERRLTMLEERNSRHG